MITELEQTALTVGQCLKQAREQQQMTAQQVALQLNLKTSLIEDLESDRFDAKLSPTFYRGYLRSYAKLLKLPEKALLEQYSKEHKGQQPAPSLTRSFSKRTAKEATDIRYIWLTWLVVVSFVVLLVMYFWQNRFDGQAVSAPLPMVEAEQTAQQQEENANAAGWTNEADNGVTASDSAVAEDTGTESGLSDTAQTTGEVAEQLAAPLPTTAPATTVSTTTEAATTVPQITAEPEVNNSPAQQSETLPQNQTEPAVVTTETPTPTATQTEQNTANLNSPAAAEVSANTTATQHDDSSLSLTFSGDCWVEITDAAGKRLAFGARSAGESLTLSGVAPVKVLLGNAASVQLSFNGQAVDLSGYAQGRVARLTLGQ